ncbi:hypothetical protein [Photobacterium sp. GB-3]|uniref:hypothetical protein n=1 Tax=Photobacterium sp. GB-3 TaxID=2022110 RepID=UPI000D168079|nr:hypothetical protein [Photobacterium sp. GB-3]PSV56455.1 hypothetical protein C9J43_11980 [Photobacterium sp. GB-3]
MRTIFAIQTKVMFGLGLLALFTMLKESAIPIVGIFDDTIIENILIHSSYREITFNLSCSLLVGFMVWLFDSFIPNALKLYRRKKSISRWMELVYESKELLVMSLDSFAKQNGCDSYKEFKLLGNSDSKYAMQINLDGSPKVSLYDINEAISSLDTSFQELLRCEDIFDYSTNETLDDASYKLARTKATFVGEEFMTEHRQFLRLRTLVDSVEQLLQCPQLRRI